MSELGRRRRGGRAERTVVPEAQFTSYYGRPVLKAPTWKAPEIAGYFFLGGLAGGSSLLAAGADLTGRHALRRSARLMALGAIGLSGVALVKDLGRPERFHHMLRVLKPTSPMSVGSWLLAGYGPLAGAAAASELTGLLPAAGRAAGLGAAAVAPAIASYTAVLAADTAVPAWHEARHDLPFVFVGSAAAAAAGWGLLSAPLAEAAPARRLAVLGSALELAASMRMHRRLGLAREAYAAGRAAALDRLARGLTTAGAVTAATVGRRNRLAAALAGGALLAGSACTRFAVFEAGVASAKDPKYTVIPQRERVDQGRRVRGEAARRPS